MKTSYVPNLSSADGRIAYPTAIPVIGSPQGVLSGVPGMIAVDTLTGNIWVKKTGNGNTGWAMGGGGGGGGSGGTVTSVAFAGDGVIFNSSAGTPVTTSGSISPVLKAENANLILAGPSSGGAANPTFRAFVNSDFPAGLSPSFQGSNLTNIPAANFTSGTIPNASFPSPLTYLNGPYNEYTTNSNITEGTSTLGFIVGGFVMLTLPSIQDVIDGAIFIIKFPMGSQATVLVIQPYQSDDPLATIDNQVSLVLANPGDFAVLVFYSGNWYIASAITQ